MKTSFQARVTLTSVVPNDAEMREWICDLEFFDADGAYTGLDVTVGDVIAVDTSPHETGSFSFYTINEIVSPGGTNLQVRATFIDNNDLIFGPPDIGSVIGALCTVARPSTNLGLLPVVSKDFQGVNDKYTEYVQNYNFVKIVDNISGGSPPQVLNSTTPTPTALGGIPAGTTFNSVPVEVVLQSLLYPYQAPTFSAFSISGQSTTLEVGATVTGANRTFTWTATNASNITANTVEIQNITGGTTSLAVGLANDGTEVLSFADATKTTATTHVWRIRATNTQTTVFTRDFTVTWQWRRFFGESVNTTLTENQIEALRVNGLVSGLAGNYSFNAGGYKWIAYPTVFGTATTFKDTSTNLDVPFEPPVIVSVTNAFGVVQDYRVHRTTNVLGGAITIAVS